MKYAGVEQLSIEDLRANIKIAESNGNYNCEAQEPDWSLMQRVDEKYDYAPKNFFWQIWVALCRFVLITCAKPGCALLMGSGVVGRENLRGIKNAVIVCNHVHNLDNVIVRWGFVGFRLYIAVAEFNNMKGFLGNFMRGGGILPLSGNFSAMKNFSKRVNSLLKKGKNVVLYYPEKSMWTFYEQPRPFMDGAFHAAVVNGVPVVPTFIVWKDPGFWRKIFSKEKEAELHILKPVYPNAEFDRKKNIAFMRDEAFRECCECYKEFYGKEAATVNAKFVSDEIFMKGYENYLETVEAEKKKAGQ